MKRSSSWAPAAVVVVAALLLGGCGGADDEPSAKSGSTTSSSPSPTADPAADLVPLDGNGFAMKLRQKAVAEEQTFDTKVGKVKATLYTDAGDDDAFVVAMNAYPAGTRVDLDGAVRGVAQNVGGTVDVNETVEVQGNPARQVRIAGTSAGNEVTVYLLAVNVDNKLFQLQYVLRGAAPATTPEILDTVAGTITFD